MENTHAPSPSAPSASSADRARSVRRPVLASLATVAAITATLGLIGIGTAIEQSVHPPTCYGIGWGCTPDPLTTAGLVGVIVGVPVAFVALVLTWVGWALTRLRTGRVNRVATWWPVWVLTAGMVVCAVLVVATAG